MYNILPIELGLLYEIQSVWDGIWTFVISMLILMFEFCAGLWIVEIYKSKYNDKSFQTIH